MPMAITDPHRELAGVARSFLEKHHALPAARALLDAPTTGLPPFWDDLVALGWLGLHVSEAYGGSGFGLLEVAVVVEEMGRVLAPGPFLPTVVASALIEAAGTPEQRERWLPGLVDGSCTAGIGLVDSEDGPTGDVDASHWPAVLGAETADVFVLVVGADVAVIPRGIGTTVGTRANLDLTRRSQPVMVTAAALGAGDLLRDGRLAADRMARVLVAAEAAGGASACVETASEYAKVRQQFGRTIATFQAIKHRCAEMLASAERAVAATWDAARASGSAAQLQLAASIAAHEALTGYLACAKSNIQVHGGIGYTWEHDAHLHLRRAGSLQALFGPVDELARQITELADAGALRADQIELPPEAEGYRSDVREFLDRIEGLEAPARDAAFLEEGYAQPHWPRPWGRSAGAVEQLVIEQEMKGVRRPGAPGIGGWITLTLIQHASADQAQRWIRPSMGGENPVVPTVQRARRRLGRRGDPDTGRSGRGGLGAQRPKDLDQRRAGRDPRTGHCAHRSSGAQARRHHRCRRRHVRAGGRGATLTGGDRQRHVQRGVLQRRLRARRRCGRAGQRRLDGRRARPWAMSG